MPPEKDQERIAELKGTPLYDKATGSLARQVLSAWGAAEGPEGRAPWKVTCWALSPDGKFVAIGAGYVKKGGRESFGAVSVCEVSTGRRVAERRGGLGCVEYVAFSQDGKTVYYRAQPFLLHRT